MWRSSCLWETPFIVIVNGRSSWIFCPLHWPNLLLSLMVCLIMVHDRHFPIRPWNLSHTYALVINRIVAIHFHYLSINFRWWNVPCCRKPNQWPYLPVGDLINCFKHFKVNLYTAHCNTTNANDGNWGARHAVIPYTCTLPNIGLTAVFGT